MSDEATASDEGGPWTVLEDDEPVNSNSDSDSEFDLPPKSTLRHGLVKANKVDMQAQEQKIKDDAQKARHKSGEAKMENLMAYTHIDTSTFNKDAVDENMAALVQDEVLLNVLKDEDNRISFVFAKTSG